MSKFIEADKLLAEMDRQKIGYNTDGKHAAEYNTCIKILSIITSLQQEQPADGDDGKFVKFLVRNEFAERFQKLCDEVQAGQSSFVGAFNPREQPEVDYNIVPLSEERMASYIAYCLGREDDDCNCPTCGKHVTGLRLFPYYYDRENNDVYFASVCPECGNIIISKE